MKHQEIFPKLVFIPKISTSIIFLLLILLMYFLFMGRKNESLKLMFLLESWPYFYKNVSNFAISYVLFSGIGYIWLLLGINLKKIIFLGLAFLLCNFVYEVFIPILNTPDINDAYFGFAGTALAFIFLLLTKKYGLALNPKNKE